jgi:hypothetical protein
MSKVVTSPVKRFPGTVTLSDPLNYPQVITLEEAISEAGKLSEPTQAAYNYTLLPGVLKCVEVWSLEGFPASVTADTFPATPRVPSAELLGWLIGEVVALYREADESPNE